MSDAKTLAFLGIFIMFIMVIAAVAGGYYVAMRITSNMHMPIYHSVPPMVIDTVPIYSINFGQLDRGSFILGTGSINSQSVYYYYQKRSDGGLVLSHIPTDGSVIYMDSTNNTANIVISSIDTVDCNDKITDTQCARDYSWRRSYAIHVPPNTVRKEFDGNP